MAIVASLSESAAKTPPWTWFNARGKRKCSLAFHKLCIS